MVAFNADGKRLDCIWVWLPKGESRSLKVCQKLYEGKWETDEANTDEVK